MIVTELKQKIVRQLDRMEPEQLAFVASFLDNLTVYSQSTFRMQTSLESKREVINRLKGKYSDLKTSSDEFARRKQEEIDLEESRWQ